MKDIKRRIKIELWGKHCSEIGCTVRFTVCQNRIRGSLAAYGQLSSGLFDRMCFRELLAILVLVFIRSIGRWRHWQINFRRLPALKWVSTRTKLPKGYGLGKSKRKGPAHVDVEFAARSSEIARKLIWFDREFFDRTGISWIELIREFFTLDRFYRKNKVWITSERKLEISLIVGLVELSRI